MADIGFTARKAGPQAGPSLSLLFSYGGRRTSSAPHSADGRARSCTSPTPKRGASRRRSGNYTDHRLWPTIQNT